MSRKKRYIKLKERSYVLVCSAVVGLIVILGGTFAWVTLADTRINRMDTSRLEVTLEGNQNVSILTPVYESSKQLTVRNDSGTNALIRVSLSEVLLQFKVFEGDVTQEGTGELQEVTPTTSVVNLSNSQTWQEGATYTNEQGQTVEATQRTENEQVEWPMTLSNRLGPLNDSTVVNYGSQLTGDFPVPTSFVRSFWFYSEGYFYYSELLRPGKVTPVLVESVQVAPKAPNVVKGSLYDLIGEVEGLPASKEAITNPTFGWGLPEGGPVYQLLQDKVK